MSYRILWMSDHPACSTNYGRMTREILTRLAQTDKFTIECVGRTHRGATWESSEVPYKVHSIGSNMPNQEKLDQIIQKFRPDVLVTTGDLNDMLWVTQLECRNLFRWIGCFPVTEAHMPEYCTDTIEDMDIAVAWSPFGEEVIKAALPDKEISVIPYGVDINTFRRLENRSELREAARQDGNFLVGSVVESDMDSHIPSIAEAFRLLLEKHSNTALYLSTSTSPLANTSETLRQYAPKCADIIPPVTLAPADTSEATNANLNVLDLMVLPDASEYLMPIAMQVISAGIPLITPNNGDLPGILDGISESVQRCKHKKTTSGGIAYDYLAELLETLYNIPDHRADMAYRGRLFAESNNWNNIALKWSDLLESTAGKHQIAPRNWQSATKYGRLADNIWKKGPVNIAKYESLIPSYNAPEVRFDYNPHEKSDLNVVWRSSVLEFTGFGAEARSFILPLSRRIRHFGIQEMDLLPSDTMVCRDELAIISQLKAARLSPPYIEIVDQAPDYFKRNETASYRIGRTMFEMAGLSEYWTEECNAMDEIWVPSNFCMKIFESSGVNPEKLSLVPGPIDRSVFTPREKKEGSVFRFLTVCQFSRRKGWDKIIQAYVKEFTFDDPVELVFRIYSPMRPLTEIAESITSFVRSLRVQESLIPPIVLVEGTPLNSHEMSELYRSADVLVAPSRGEGYGRPILEALSCGIPVITTGWGGQTDFVSEKNGWLLDYDLTFADQGDHPGYRGKCWAEPSLEHLRYAMREAFTSTETLRMKSEHAPESVAEYDQERVADLVMEKLSQIDISSRPSYPMQSGPSGKPLMITSPYERCAIREYSDCLIQAGLPDTLISNPDLYRNFITDADLIHIQYHPYFFNPHQFLHHTPDTKLIATVHDITRFEEISHLFDGIIVHNSAHHEAIKNMQLKDNTILKFESMPYFAPVADKFTPSERTSPVIAYYGLLHETHGLKDMLYGFAQLRRTYPAARLLAATIYDTINGEYARLFMEDCKRIASELGLAEHVEFTGHELSVADIPQLFNKEADLVVLPYSDNRNLASIMALRAAAASCKPVITSDIRAMKEAGDGILKFPYERISYLADTMSAVLENTSMQQFMVDRIIGKSGENSWKMLSDRLQSIYEIIAAK